MKVKATFAFFFDTFFLKDMPTDATVAMHLDSLYTTHFSIIICTSSDKK